MPSSSSASARPPSRPACQPIRAAWMAGSSLKKEVSNTLPTFSTTITRPKAAFTWFTMASSASVR